MNTIVCPNCKKPVEISEAISRDIEEKQLAKIEEEYKQKLEKAKQDAIDSSNKKLREQFELQEKELREDNLAKEERNRELLEKVSMLMDEMRKTKHEKEELQIEMKKKLAEEEEKIRTEAQKKAEEEQHTKIAEKDKQLSDALKELEEMRRKLQQGSQQAQGETFELEFEEMLRQQYKNDEIEPVGKGMTGGDVIQKVWDSKGNYAGKILWELKNTKTWSDLWVSKLKADRRAIAAEEAVIITSAMPTDIKVAGFKEQIWVTKREFVIPLADALRAKLISLFRAKQSVQGKNEKVEVLYNYLSGTEFRHRVEAIVEAFTNMQSEIEKEKRYFMNKWARDEKNIRQVIDNTYGMHGDLKGIIGTSLPAIAGIEDEALSDGLTRESEIITRKDGIRLSLKQKIKDDAVEIRGEEVSKKSDVTEDDEAQALF